MIRLATTLLIGAAALAVAIPSAAQAGGSEEGSSRDCGTLLVKPARPGRGLPKAGGYDLNSFDQRAGRTPIPCSQVRAIAVRYRDTGLVPVGYTIKGYPNMIGRNFLVTGNPKRGFQIIWSD